MEQEDETEKTFLLGLNYNETGDFFGREQYLTRYGIGPGGSPNVNNHLDEFNDWILIIPYIWNLIIPCCPEDRRCEELKQENLTTQNQHFCTECEFPICTNCLDKIR